MHFGKSTSGCQNQEVNKEMDMTLSGRLVKAHFSTPSGRDCCFQTRKTMPHGGTLNAYIYF